MRGLLLYFTLSICRKNQPALALFLLSCMVDQRSDLRLRSPCSYAALFPDGFAVPGNTAVYHRVTHRVTGLLTYPYNGIDYYLVEKLHQNA